MRVAFLTRYTEQTGASSRVRVYQYLPHLERLGIQTRVLARWPPASRTSRLAYVARALRLASWADVLVLQKPNQPLWLIDLLAAANGRLIVDFDDAIWSPVTPTDDPGVLATFRGLERRLRHAIGRAGCVTTASRHLEAWAASRCPGARVVLIPEAIDLDAYRRVKTAGADGSVVVGWSGSPGNVIDLDPVIPALAWVADRGEALLRIISGRPPEIRGVGYDYRPWSPETEIDGLLSLDVGIMPLHDNPRSWGRCGFKAIQYMGVGLPVVASPVGGALDVVRDGVTGYLADSTQAWGARLTELVRSVDLRRAMGTEGRRRAQEAFSVQANLPLLVELFERRASRRTPPPVV